MNEIRKLATIRKIASIEPIENADMIELAMIDGWQVITKKNEFKSGDWCVYIEIDSVLPEVEPFEFLRSRSFRIKTQKMRGQLSQGICFPLSIFASLGLPLPLNQNIDPETGYEDVTDLLGIKKYEPAMKFSIGGSIMSNFIENVPKTDAERVQNLVGYVAKWKDEDKRFIASEKLDGTSLTTALINDEFMVCSRNYRLNEDETNLYWNVARKYDIETKLRRAKDLGYNNIVIQGEIVGPNIQSNKYKLQQPEVFFFTNAFNYDKSEYLTVQDTLILYRYLELNHVPILDFDLSIRQFDTVKDIIEFADGKSVLNSNTMREGIVFVTETKYNHKRIIFKSISNKFLLKNED